MSSIVAIVGRPNVGKSTLFNRLTESRRAIVDEASGVTRDRQYGKCQWNGREFSVIDTGGYAANTDDIFETEIRRQVELAIEEAQVVLFVVDTLTGVTDYDDVVADMLRRSGKPVVVAANKTDTGARLADTYEFLKFGLGDAYPISSASGSGTGDLLDRVLELLPPGDSGIDDQLPKFAIVGRPNVGKSSLLNAFIGEERHIVTDIAGTTRDSIFTRYNKFGHDFYLVDTAGLRKKNKEKEDVEFYSTMRSVRAIEDCDVCLLMLDAERGLEAQDKKIFSLIARNRKGVVVVVNKWDTVPQKDSNTTKRWEDDIRRSFAPYSDIPIVFTSVPQKQRIHKALEEAVKVYDNMKRRIGTSQLNQHLLEAIAAYPPPATKGKEIHIKYVTQLPTPTPTFAFFCNLPQWVKDPYKRFLENTIRRQWDFNGVPIAIVMRKK